MGLRSLVQAKCTTIKPQAKGFDNTNNKCLNFTQEFTDWRLAKAKIKAIITNRNNPTDFGTS